MSERATPRDVFWIGAAALAGGLYFSLVGLGMLPVPGGRGNLHGPLWLALAVGIVFALAGLSALLQAAADANAQGELPEKSPRWMRAAQYLIAVLLLMGLATIGSWIAISPGERHISGTLPMSGAANAWIGRAVFGIGALITWAAALAFAVVGARKIFLRDTT
ncbi:MAG: hypothetical protein ABIL01_18910 [Pseudomonadota bacterium]